jgi:hypothetical protein
MADFEELQLSDYSDEDLLRYIKSAERLFPADPHCRIKALSSNLVAKVVSGSEGPDELAAIDMADSIGVRVPTIRRMVAYQEQFYVVMDPRGCAF